MGRPILAYLTCRTAPTSCVVPRPFRTFYRPKPQYAEWMTAAVEGRVGAAKPSAAEMSLLEEVRLCFVCAWGSGREGGRRVTGVRGWGGGGGAKGFEVLLCGASI